MRCTSRAFRSAQWVLQERRRPLSPLAAAAAAAAACKRPPPVPPPALPDSESSRERKRHKKERKEKKEKKEKHKKVGGMPRLPAAAPCQYAAWPPVHRRTCLTAARPSPAAAAQEVQARLEGGQGAGAAAEGGQEVPEAAAQARRRRARGGGGGGGAQAAARAAVRWAAGGADASLRPGPVRLLLQAARACRRRWWDAHSPPPTLPLCRAPHRTQPISADDRLLCMPAFIALPLTPSTRLFPALQPISADDYFLKNKEYAAWLREERGVFFRRARGASTLCCAVLCCAVLCCAVLCCAVLRCAALWLGSLAVPAPPLAPRPCACFPTTTTHLLGIPRCTAQRAEH